MRDPSDSKDDCAGKYTTSIVTRNTYPSCQKGIHLHHPTTSIKQNPKEQDEDSTARCLGLEAQVRNTPEHTLGARISAGAAAASLLLSKLVGLQIP